MWNYDDDWQEKKAQREQEDYDRWYGEREAEKDARAGYYSPPSCSADAYDSYEDKWSNVDSRERAEVARRAHDEEQDREQKSGSKRDNANSFDNSYNSDPETYPSINNYSSKSNFLSSNFSFSKHILVNYILPIFMLIAIAKTV